MGKLSALGYPTRPTQPSVPQQTSSTSCIYMDYGGGGH